MSGIRIAAIPLIGIAFRYTQLPDGKVGILDFWQMTEDEWSIALRGLTSVDSPSAPVIIEDENESIAQVPMLGVAFSLARFSEDDDRIVLVRCWQMSDEERTSALVAAGSSARVIVAHLRDEQWLGPVCRSTSSPTIAMRRRKSRRDE